MAALLKTTLIQEPSSSTVNMTLGSTGGVTFGAAATANTVTSAATTALTIQSAGTTAMTIDTSQQVNFVGNGVVNINPTTGTNQATLFASNTGGNFYFGKNDSAGSQFATDAYASVVWSSGNRPIVMATNGAERMRIDSSGNFMVGTTTYNNNPSQGFAFLNATNSTLNIGHASGVGSGQNYMIFAYNGGAIGGITQNGTTGVAYNVSSDYRLKENVTPMTTGLATISALKPVTYDWISDKSEGEGFIAHELQAVIPHAVTGTKDAVDADGKPVYQGVDYSKIVVHLVAAIQEQQATIASLTTRIATLEAK
jgi:hypothetical protein